jgi:hypothetical protein
MKRRSHDCSFNDLMALLLIVSEATFLLRHDNDGHMMSGEIDSTSSSLVSIVYDHLPIRGVVDLVLLEYLNSGVHGYGLELIEPLLSSSLNFRYQPLAHMKTLVDTIAQIADVNHSC